MTKKRWLAVDDRRRFLFPSSLRRERASARLRNPPVASSSGMFQSLAGIAPRGVD
jgi:hypothetical protein